MTTFMITVPDKAKAKLSQFVKEIGGEMVKAEPDTKKQKLLNEIQTGLKEVKAIREGKMKAYSMDDLLNDK